MANKYTFDDFDPLSDALDLARLRGRVYCYCEFSSAWALKLDKKDSSYFHVVERGGCRLQIGDEPPLSLTAGDFVLILNGGGHTLYDSLKAVPIVLEDFLKLGKERRVIKYGGGGGAETHLVCGEFAFDGASGNPLFALLPPVIHLQSSQREHDWLETALRQLAYETRNSGSGAEVVIRRLTDIIFVQAVRAWVARQPKDQTGWLGALGDEQIGKTLSLIHRQPEVAWNLTTLAREIGMSRSKFAALFRQSVGETPVSYLTKWRMQVARRLLTDENTSVAETARRVGYQSETSFSKVFKQQFGATPSSLRRPKK